MKGFAVIIVGYQGAGKSLLSKNVIKKANHDRLRILDIYEEYLDFTDGELQYIDEEDLIDPDAFTEDMIKLKDKIFVAEDATFIFPHRGYDKRLVRAIVGKRHSGNVYMFLFHSLRVIPIDVYAYADEIWLLKTADTEDGLKDKFKGTGVIELWQEVNKLPEFEWSEKQPLPLRDKHYKVMQIKKGKIDKTVTRNQPEI
jgi:hypothetical protein